MKQAQALSFLLVLVVFVLPATAGTLDYTNGAARWESTNCQKPAAPVYNRGSADQLSANVNAYNAYTAQVQNYLNCLNAEAQQDLNSIQSQVTGQLNQINQNWQAEMNRHAQTLNSLRNP